MTFNKAAIDVLTKGLDPKHPHFKVGSDGLLQVPTKQPQETVVVEAQKPTESVISISKEPEVSKELETAKTEPIVSISVEPEKIEPVILVSEEQPDSMKVETVAEVPVEEEKPKRRPPPPPRKKANPQSDNEQ